MMKSKKNPAKFGIVLALAAVLAIWSMPVQATTFNLSTLNDYTTGSGRSAVDHGYYTGVGGTGTYIFSKTLAQQNPWTQSLGNADQASINFTVPTMGNNGGKIYMSAGALFPIPAGQSLGTGQSGYSGDYNLGSFPLYFAFSNPTYDNNCGFNCNTITQRPVTVNSLWTTDGTGATITGYSDLGQTAIYSMVITGSGLQQIILNWTGVEEISISGGSFYINDIEVNDPIPSVPEPATMMLLGLGLAGVAVARKKFQK
jgi:PEP-CTERM motif